MDYYKEFSAQVQKIWDEKNCTPQQQQEGEEEDMDTPTTSTDCCGRDCAKLYEKISDVDSKVQAVCNKLNLFIDDQQHQAETKNGPRYGSVEEKLDQILFRLDESVQALGGGSPPSEGGKTYLVGPDRFEDLKAWFKEFCLKELKEIK